MLKSLLNEQEVTFPNVPPRQVLQQLVDKLNSEKNTNDYEFIVDDQRDVNGTRINLGYMRLLIKKKLTFEKNSISVDEDLWELNRMLNDSTATEKHDVLFVVNDANTLRASILQDSQYNKCSRRPVIFKTEMATEMFKEIYEYLSSNPILFILDQFRYWAVAYQGLDDFNFEAILKSEYVEQAIAKAKRDYSELKLMIEASNI